MIRAEGNVIKLRKTHSGHPNSAGDSFSRPYGSSRADMESAPTGIPHMCVRRGAFHMLPYIYIIYTLTNCKLRGYAKKASPGGKLAPQATEGECESLGLKCYSRTDNRTV